MLRPGQKVLECVHTGFGHGLTPRSPHFSALLRERLAAQIFLSAPSAHDFALRRKVLTPAKLRTICWYEGLFQTTNSLARAFFKLQTSKDELIWQPGDTTDVYLDSI